MSWDREPNRDSNWDDRKPSDDLDKGQRDRWDDQRQGNYTVVPDKPFQPMDESPRKPGDDK